MSQNSNRSVLWISRKLLENTKKQAARDYDVILIQDDTVSNAEDILEMSQKVDAIFRVTPRYSQPMSLPVWTIGSPGSPTLSPSW